MTTATGTTPAQLLELWLDGGGLKSQYYQYVDSIRTGEPFYADMLANKGRAVAEAVMHERINRLRVSKYAAGIEPVARGMLALAQASNTSNRVKAIEVRGRFPYPTSYSISNPSKMVVVFNHQTSGCGCQLPKSSGIFSIDGLLGLRAVTLQVGNSRKSGEQTAQLGLVLPNRAHPNEPANSFVVAAIELTGETYGHDRTLRFDREGLLLHALGLANLDRAVNTMTSSYSQFDDAIGFPGATNYLADSLPELGEYFAALALDVGPGHKH